MGRKKRAMVPAVDEDTSDLPCEFVYDILSRLPVKSLQRFKSVCKSWSRVIAESEFTKTHLRQYANLDRKKLIMSCFYKNSGWFYSVDYDSPHDSKELLHFPVDKYGNCHVLSSCIGLILLRVPCSTKFVLWNPFTGDCKCFRIRYFDYISYCICVICYDSSHDEYKIAFVRDAHEGSSVVVFSLRNRSRKEIKGILPYSFSGCRNSFSCYHKRIFALDYGKES